MMDLQLTHTYAIALIMTMRFGAMLIAHYLLEREEVFFVP